MLLGLEEVAEERRERRLELQERLRVAVQLGLDARRNAERWEAQARLLQLELDADASYQVTLG